MQNFYALISAGLLLAFVAMVALKVNSEILEQESLKIENADLEDTQDDEMKEIQFELKDFNHSSSEKNALPTEMKNLVDYLFAIKSNSQKVSSPPPEA